MSAMWEYRDVVLKGLLLTVEVFALGLLLAVVVAFILGIAGLSERRWVRWPVIVWVEFWRGTSMLVQMFILFYVLPFYGLQWSPFTCAVLALGLNEGAYASEIVRGAIAGRAKGQNEAGIALGMSKALRMRRILVPQSIPAMLPAFGNVAVDTLKNTSLVSLVTVAELTYQTQQVWKSEGHAVAIFSTLMVLYFILAMVVAGGVKLLERRFAIDRTNSLFSSRFLPTRAGVGA